MTRLLLLLVSVAGVSGCSRQPPTPKLPPIAKISAKVHAVPELGFSAIDHVEVPQEHISEFATLITPTTPCVQTIDRTMRYHVADVVVQHEDGSTTKLVVRWTGHNPAAISLDDSHYFYGGSDDFPDGATRIIRLLNQYQHQHPNK